MNAAADKVGTFKIEPFKLPSQSGAEIDSATISSPYIVLFFYPKDSTPGCTREAIAFSQQLGDLEALGATVFGVSGGNITSKAKFCERSTLTVSLLADEDLTLAKALGAYGPKKFMGRSYEGILRKTFILDKYHDNNYHTVLGEIEGVKPELHALKVIELIRSFR